MFQPSLARACVLLAFASLSAPLHAAGLPPDTELAVDAIVSKAVDDKGVASVSVAIVRDGKIVYARAYGDARLAPAVPARPEMRYKIASNSKQFAATAVLMLAEEGKLKLDDPVARYFPHLSRAKDVTLRMLLTHTSGYSDYYAPDYLLPSMTADIAVDKIMQDWAAKPLDFEPGTRYQYSNTNYVILGRVVEKASGQPFSRFLRKRVLDKLHMDSAIDINEQAMGQEDPLGYTRHAGGPLRQIGAEGKGWSYATGELAMTASDLARWDVSLMDGTLLKPASLRALTTAARLKDGTATSYALGLNVSQMASGHRKWQHTGMLAGFTSINTTYPDDRTAITVLTNSESGAGSKLTNELEKLLLAGSDPLSASAQEAASKIFTGLQKGTAERALMTDDLSGYLTEAALADFAASLGPMGTVTEFKEVNRNSRGGMTARRYLLKMSGGKSLGVAAYIKPDGRFDQFLVGERN